MSSKSKAIVATPKLIRTASVLNEGYVTVDEKGSKDPDTKTVDGSDGKGTVPLKNLLTRAVGKKGGVGKLKNLKMDLWTGAELNGVANTVYTTAINVDPSASAEYSSIAQLYDEVIVHGGTVHMSLTSSGGTPVEVHWACVYDPEESSAYSTLTAALSASQKCGPLRACPTNYTGITMTQPTSKTGMITWKFKCPRGAQKTTAGGATSDALCTGQWTSTAQSGNYYGFLKPFIEAMGTSVVANFSVFLCMHCEFRSRT